MFKKIFMSIDRKLFELVDKMKHSATFQQLLSPIDTLPHDAQTLVNRVLALAIPVIPMIIFLLILFFNFNSRLGLKEKKNLLNQMQEITKLSNEASSYSNVLIAPVAINTKQDFELRLSSLARKNQITPNLVSVKNFQKEEMGKLGKSKISLSFKDLSTKQFTSFLNQLMIVEKVKVNIVSLSKVNTLLSGTLGIVHFAKSLPAPEAQNP